MEFEEVLGTVFVVGLVAPFVLVPIKMALCGDRENNVHGWIWNRDGWKDPNYKLIEKLEQWELFYRQGCYFSGENCEHKRHQKKDLDTLRILLLEAKGIPEWHSRSEYTSEIQEQMFEEKKRSLTCVTLDEELSRFRFDALETHTKHVGTMITEGKKWISG